MKRIKGAREYQKFIEGKRLTRKESMSAFCYVCNGGDEGNVDCLGTTCPMYIYFPYQGKKKSHV